MATPLSLPSLLVFFFSFLLFVALSDSSPPATTLREFQIPLTHSLASSPDLKSAAVHHLLRQSSLRSAARHRRRRRQQNHHQNQQQLSVPLFAGSDYTLSLSLPPSTAAFSLYMDTGSDLVWLPESPFNCILCDGKPTSSSLLSSSSSSSSSTVPCNSPLCSAAHSSSSSLSSSDLCAIAGCRLDDIETSSCSSGCPSFYYAYGDGSLVAELRRAPEISIAGLKVPNFTIGSANIALAEPVGVAGFGGGAALSIPAQLAGAHPSLASRFSYCLVPHSFRSGELLRPSPLILGRSGAGEPTSFVYTPMLRNPNFPFLYTVSLEAISVAGARIEASAAADDMAVDSGTTFTILPAGMFSRVAAEFRRGMAEVGFRRARDAEAETGLRPCYRYGWGRREEGIRVPAVELHFAGNATVRLPRRNYFMGFEIAGGRVVGCLMMMDGGEDDGGGGPAATLGNFQQQGMEVAYDLEGRRVGFARRRCGDLWDSSRGGGGP